MIALWGRSRTPYSGDELSHWRAALARVHRELTRLRVDGEPGDQHEADE